MKDYQKISAKTEVISYEGMSNALNSYQLVLAMRDLTEAKLRLRAKPNSRKLFEEAQDAKKVVMIMMKTVLETAKKGKA